MSDPRATPPAGAWLPGDVSGHPVAHCASYTCLPISQRTNDRFFVSPVPPTTNAIHNQNTARCHPLILPNDVTISHVGMEVTVAGDVGSIFRVGVWEDTGTVLPGALLVEASATVDGTSVAVQEVACPITLEGHRLYWIGSLLQGAAIVQPTIRCLASPPVAGIRTGSTPTAGALHFGYTVSPFTGALSTVVWGTNPAVGGMVPRYHLRLA